MLKHYSVVSPEYMTSSGSYYENPEPPEYGCATADVLAPTKRQARIIAIRAWRDKDYEKEHPDEVENAFGDLGYCDDGNENPFKV